MPYISKITLPESGGTYDIKDAEARQLISQLTGITFVIAWDGSSTPVVANIPKNVVVRYNSQNYTGTLEAADADTGTFYLVHSSTQVGTGDVYDEYVVVTTSSLYGTKAWEKIGDTQANIGGTDVVLGEGTTFTNASSSVSFSGGTTDVVLGEATTFTATGTAVTPTTTYLEASASGTAVGSTTKYLSASASGTAVGANGTASAVTGYASPTTATFIKSTGLNDSKMETSTANKSTWTFKMGTGTGNTETLIIGGGNGNDVTVATGSVSANGSGATVVTGLRTYSATADAITALGDPSTSTVLTGVQVTTQPTITLTANDSTATGRITYLQALGTVTQPTIALSTKTSSATGRVKVATGISSVTQPTISAGTDDKVTAVTSIGTGTAGAQTITVGTNDKVTVLTPAT